MTRIEIGAALVAAAVVGLCALWAYWKGRPRPAPGRGARFLLWFAIASPLLFLLTYEGDRPRVWVMGSNGRFEALRLLSFCAAATAVVLSVRPLARRWWSTALLVSIAGTAGLVAAALYVR